MGSIVKGTFEKPVPVSQAPVMKSVVLSQSSDRLRFIDRSIVLGHRPPRFRLGSGSLRRTLRGCGIRGGLACLAVLLILSACDRQARPSIPTIPAPAQAPTGQPQSKLPTVKLWLGPQELTVEQAVTENQVTNGMMFR
jgi:hypothetical protein